MSEIFKDYGVEITLKNPDDFLKVKETLTRIGIASKKENKLYQTCHIFHKQGHYAIFHFKEMFMFDGKDSNFTEEDKARRNKIVELLEDWNLLDVLNPEEIEFPIASMSNIKILSHKEKGNWKFEEKYSLGTKK